jgi:hypothetical protein
LIFAADRQGVAGDWPSFWSLPLGLTKYFVAPPEMEAANGAATKISVWICKRCWVIQICGDPSGCNFLIVANAIRMTNKYANSKRGYCSFR